MEKDSGKDPKTTDATTTDRKKTSQNSLTHASRGLIPYWVTRNSNSDYLFLF